jgi:poly-gamma-glutamate system protein
MKKIYWRPQGLSLTALFLICVISVGGFIFVEKFPKKVKHRYYQEKLAAARLALEAMEFLREERLKRGPAIDPEADPLKSGLIGSAMTLVTSDAGDLEDKQASINPNFAAVVVEMLKRAKAKEGDPVAVSFTGSFPALNISVCAAIEALKLNPTIISSLASSQWGANEPDFLWVDMERLLYENHIFPFRSVAASLGGKGDRGREMTQAGRDLLKEAMKRNGLPPIPFHRIYENVDHRMKIYYRNGAPKVFINVGGGVIAVGKRAYKKVLKPGLMLSRPKTELRANSVMYHFLDEGIPVIHLENVKTVAEQYGLDPHPVKMPAIGEGMIYFSKGHNRLLSGIVLLAIILTLYIFARSTLGFRISQAASHTEEPGPPEPMI